jgi:nitrate/TMAO reductase-like tetraheme cytochrome c subunit
VTRRFLPVLLFLSAGPLAADPRDFGVPEPHGWLGTTTQWIQGFGLVLAALNVVILLVLWARIRRRGVTSASKAFILGSVVVLPTIVAFLATAHGMSESMKTEACGACHIMDGHFADLRNPKNDSLAAVHYKNRYIQENHCYTCHSDYGFSGTVGAKLAGLGHTWRNLTGHYELPLKIRAPYSNVRCLACHGGAQNFVAKHDKDEIPNLLSGKDSCLDCHGPAHKPESGKPAEPEKQASR